MSVNWRWWAVLLPLLMCLCFTDLVLPLTSPSGMKNFLLKHMRISAREMKEMEEGKTVARQVPTRDDSEIASFGVVQVHVPQEFFISRFRDIEKFKGGGDVPEIGVFHTPPTVDDLRALTLEESDIKSIRKCKPGDCKIKLPPDALGWIQTEVNWTSQTATQKTTELFKRSLTEYVSKYLLEGNPALLTYHDGKDPVSLRDEFRSLMRNSFYVGQDVPEFFQYLLKYPDVYSRRVESFVYWSKEIYGGRPVMTVTHASIYRGEENGEVFHAIASKQIYASHYYNASLSLTGLISLDSANPEKGFYLMYLNRSRLDVFEGLLSEVKRSIIESRTTQSLKDYMEKIRQETESSYAAGRNAGWKPADHNADLEIGAHLPGFQ